MEIIELIIRQADYLLKEQGEFYPFAAIETRTGEIRPLGLLLDQDQPQATLVVDQLDKLLEKGISEGGYRAGAIGIQVTLNRDGILPSDALEIRYKPGNGIPEKILCLPYKWDLEGALVFDRIFALD